MNLRYCKGVVFTILVFAALAYPVLSVMDGKSGMGHGMEVKNISDMQQGRELRHEAGMQGMGFMHKAGSMFGNYITFEVDETGTITDYAINGNVIYDSINIDGFQYGDTISMGTVTRVIESDGTTLVQVNDNPAGVINIISSDAFKVSFNLARGVKAEAQDNMIKIESSDIDAYIIYSGDEDTFEVSVESVESVDGIVTIDAPPDSAVVVRAAPVNMPGQAQMHRMFALEVARNRVGAEVSLGENNSINVVNYSAHMRVQLQSMTKEMIKLKVSSTDPAGKIMAFNLDNTSLILQERARLRIFYDGTPLPCVDDPELVFNATNAACWIGQQTQERAQIMMHIPEFSDHEIEIVVESEEEPAATRGPGFGAVIAALSVLSVVYLARKRIFR